MASGTCRAKGGRTSVGRYMWLILLEALAALAVLIFIVWWTMFAGRDKGERRNDADE